MIDFFRVTPKKRTLRIRSKKGVIFSNPGYKQRIIFGTGNMVFIAALIYFVYLYLPLGKVVLDYNINKGVINSDVSIWPDSSVPTLIPNSQGELPGVTNNFEIAIPKIKASANVEANISPFDRETYEDILKNDMVVHSSSSSLPGSGRGRSIFIFAHSSESGIQTVRRNPAFYLLGELINGDEMLVKKDGKTYKYVTYDRKVIKANETDYLYYADPSKEVLILQTCWPLGTNWKRLLVFGELVEVI